MMNEQVKKIINTNFLVSRLPLIRRKVSTDPCLNIDGILSKFPIVVEVSETDDCVNRLKIETAIINDNNQYLNCAQIEYDPSLCNDESSSL